MKKQESVTHNQEKQNHLTGTDPQMIQKWELVHSLRFINVFEDLKENMNTMLKNCSEETETMRRPKENWRT